MILNKKTRRSLKKIISKLLFRKQKQVIEIPSQARFGNILYFFLHCDIERKKGNNVYILYSDAMKYWLDIFPEFKTFIILPNEFNFIDNLNWLTNYYQNFGLDFLEKDLNEFIDKYILANKHFQNSQLPNKTIINIRRGDFYDKNNDLPWSFDQIKYLEMAIDSNIIILNYPIEIVSDDVEWCKKNIDFLFNNKTTEIQYNYNSSPIDDFLSICHSKNLIITNSSFSYWGHILIVE